ncbi:MAG: hypothetical protein CL912_32850 [Deltaproteobacteria bacterium]|nr:hypothetical protein [Deltaproteobacteria bacterium]
MTERLTYISTKRRIKNNLMIREILIDITTSLKISVRQTPIGRIGLSACYVSWDRRAREIPDADVV